MADIQTLVPDIQKLLGDAKPFDEAVIREFSSGLSAMLVSRLSSARQLPSLRMSNLGTPDRKLWYAINRPELAEKLPASACLKFLFGDVLEDLLLFLAEAAGHTVTFRQRKVSLYDVPGSIDGCIDGELVDVKSASTYSFKKFKAHGLVTDDPFGYRVQLDGYLNSDISSDLSRSDRGHFLVVDKTLGHICLDTHGNLHLPYEDLIARKRAMLANPEPPGRCYSDEADGMGGNRRLGIGCSYCSFKRECWPGLRTFGYSRGPSFLTVVKKLPNVPELKNYEEV